MLNVTGEFSFLSGKVLFKTIHKSICVYIYMINEKTGKIYLRVESLSLRDEIMNIFVSLFFSRFLKKFFLISQNFYHTHAFLN